MRPFLFTLISSLFLLLLQLSCDKGDPFYTITVTGKVTDSKTGLPLDSVFLSFKEVINDDDPHVDNYKWINARTNAQGEFTMHSRGNGFSNFQMSKDGYLNRNSIHLTYEPEQYYDIKLVPTDGFLKIKVQNSLPQHDSIYVLVANPSLLNELAASGQHLDAISIKLFPVKLPHDDTYEELKNYASEEFTHIYWKYGYFSKIPDAAFHDSIYLTPHDTLEYKIEY